MGRDITQCHPRLQAAATKLIAECTKHDIAIKIGECFRTVAEQDALYAQGRTEPGSIVTNAKGSSYSSQHQWGIAFDFYLNMDIDGDGKTSDDAFNDATNMFSKVGSIAKTLGLAWGGDWHSIIDKPHLYLPDWGSGTNILKQQYGTPDKFKATWGTAQGVVIRDTIPIKTSETKLTVTASSLIIRSTPKGVDTGQRYKNGEKVEPIEKCFADNEPWVRTDKGWISGRYIQGWILQGGRWWYVLPGYTFYRSSVENINGRDYCFDREGWMVTSDRITDNGNIIYII